MADCELEHTVEDESPASGTAPVEPEDELVEVAGEMRATDRSLVGPEEPAFREGRDTMDPGQQPCRVFTASTSGPLAASVVAVAEGLDARIALPGVGDHRRSGLDVGGDERVQ